MRAFLRETDLFFSRFMAPVTRRLFYVCSLVYMGAFILAAVGRGVPLAEEILSRVLVLTPYQAVLQGNVWQFVTYMFSHAEFTHYLFNMLGLFFFGSLVEQRMGGRRFLGLVLISGIVAGLFHTALGFIVGKAETGLIGFSAADFALLTAAVIYFPRMTVNVYFLFPMPMRVMAAFFGVLLFFSMAGDIAANGFFGGSISHLAHITGILAAIVLIKVPAFLNFFEDLHIPFTRRRPSRVRKGGGGRFGMGHPGRHSDPDDRYNDPHWYLDQ